MITWFFVMMTTIFGVTPPTIALYKYHMRVLEIQREMMNNKHIERISQTDNWKELG